MKKYFIFQRIVKGELNLKKRITQHNKDWHDEHSCEYYYTCAIDTDNVQRVLNGCRTLIIQNHLRRFGIIWIDYSTTNPDYYAIYNAPENIAAGDIVWKLKVHTILLNPSPKYNEEMVSFVCRNVNIVSYFVKVVKLIYLFIESDPYTCTLYFL
jgi:hypothetical protein